MLITVADQTPNIDNHKYLPTLFTSVVDCFMVFKSYHRERPDNYISTYRLLHRSLCPLGHYSLQHQWDSNHTSSPGEKPGALILADQDGHTCVYATLPYYLIRDTTLHRGFLDTLFINIHFQIFRNWI